MVREIVLHLLIIRLSLGTKFRIRHDQILMFCSTYIYFYVVLKCNSSYIVLVNLKCISSFVVLVNLKFISSIVDLLNK